MAASLFVQHNKSCRYSTSQTRFGDNHKRILKSFALDCVKWSCMVNIFFSFSIDCDLDLRVTEFGDHRAPSNSIPTRNSIDCKNIWGGKVYILGFVKNPTKLFDFLFGQLLALLLTFYVKCWFWLAKIITDCAATAHCFSLSLSDLNSLACEFNSSLRVITSRKLQIRNLWWI